MTGMKTRIKPEELSYKQASNMLFGTVLHLGVAGSMKKVKQKTEERP